MSLTDQPPGTSPETEADFDANMARIGHAVPAGRRKGLLAAYTDMRRQAALIRQEPIEAAAREQRRTRSRSCHRSFRRRRESGMLPLNGLSIAAAGAALRAGKITSRALTEDALARVAALDPKLNAFILVLRDRALAEADAADADFKSGRDRGPFHGIPYGLKDIYDLAGTPTTCHSKTAARCGSPRRPAASAAKLRRQRRVPACSAMTHSEFAIGGRSFDLPFPPARNPWDLERMPGGSSSGSAAAVASGICRMAMGSDTGGSIRGPAAWCGTVGLKKPGARARIAARRLSAVLHARSLRPVDVDG